MSRGGDAAAEDPTIPSPLWRRLLGFSMLPAIAAISPLIALPFLGRAAGPEGWASAIAGESIGTFAAIVIAFGWGTIGPALVAAAPDDTVRGRLYRDALVVRGLLAVVVLPVTIVLCAVTASPGYGLLSALMGVQGALIALSFTFFAVGVAKPGAIAAFDAIPRVITAVLAAALIAGTGVVELYPLSGIAVTLIGTGWYTVRILRRYPSPWSPPREWPLRFRTGLPVAMNEAALGAYSAVPTPLVHIATPDLSAGYASGDKMLKLGQFIPITLANAFQSWTVESHGDDRVRRIRLAIVAHGVLGIVGWAALSLLGPWVSEFLAPGSQTPTMICVILGAAFALYSVRTSMTRHLLFPYGYQIAVMRATLIGTVIGIPAMLAMAWTVGPVGVAVGYAATELVATAILLPLTIATIRRLREESERPFPRDGAAA
ncbi:lipopolysaccharide biosynthesis protein [Microbacterium sp. cx-59]|uniref:lipopolysaccharide biosynthesis protein n=1 Tax=Microbacterium sp. cx-59 TaxID=2891207 RepID=UPI001E374229|nr:hypothetical protein [Microbacterium sp. cx-59]MCC4907843.1 hypothetical protein [Microbacterium sp. cx-59]